jgi:hypothetical protein
MGGMRTVELPDEVYERAARAASARGLTVVEYLERKVEEDATHAEPRATGKRLDFPLIHSNQPGKLHITKEMIEQVELDDYLGRSGSSE